MKALATLCLSTLLGAQGAAAMTLNPRGTGQVLIFPYFTVNAHQQTLVTVTNTLPRAKLLQLRFREGYNGRDVLDFQVYLAAHDSWSGAVFSLSDAGLPGSGAAILIDDNSCTTPNIATVSPKLPDGRSYQPFLNYAYTGSEQDTGPTDDARTREGFLEIIEMAELTGNTSAAVTPLLGAPPHCDTLPPVLPDTDLAIPRGGLAGTEAIVDVAQGTLFGANADAIDGFSNHTLYFPNGSIHPNLADASPGANGFVSAAVPIGGGYMQLDYPPEQAVDAVSALLTAAQIFSAWDNMPAAGAQTDLVITLPTKHYYTNGVAGQSPGDALPPFSEGFGQRVPGRSFVPYYETLFDRAGNVVAVYPSACGFSVCPPMQPIAFAYETQVLAFSRPTTSTDPWDPLGSALAISLMPAVNIVGAGTGSLDTAAPGHQLRADAHGSFLRGLPVVGFTATSYVNANVTPGVLANYSGASALRAALDCDALVTPVGVASPCSNQTPPPAGSADAQR